MFSIRVITHSPFFAVFLVVPCCCCCCLSCAVLLDLGLTKFAAAALLPSVVGKPSCSSRATAFPTASGLLSLVDTTAKKERSAVSLVLKTTNDKQVRNTYLSTCCRPRALSRARSCASRSLTGQSPSPVQNESSYYTFMSDLDLNDNGSLYCIN